MGKAEKMGKRTMKEESKGTREDQKGTRIKQFKRRQRVEKHEKC